MACDFVDFVQSSKINCLLPKCHCRFNSLFRSFFEFLPNFFLHVPKFYLTGTFIYLYTFQYINVIHVVNINLLDHSDPFTQFIFPPTIYFRSAKYRLIYTYAILKKQNLIKKYLVLLILYFDTY